MMIEQPLAPSTLRADFPTLNREVHGRPLVYLDTAASTLKPLAVIEAVGKPAVWDDIASIIAPRARIAMTGLFAGQKCSVDFDPLVINNVTIQGALGGPSCWAEAIDLHERGSITAKPLITHRLPLASFVEGIEIMRQRKDNAIKVVLQP